MFRHLRQGETAAVGNSPHTKIIAPWPPGYKGCFGDQGRRQHDVHADFHH